MTLADSAKKMQHRNIFILTAELSPKRIERNTAVNQVTAERKTNELRVFIREKLVVRETLWPFC